MTSERGELDVELLRLETTAARVLANLVELDQTSTRALLDAADLKGETARRWSAASETLAGLFASYAGLAKALEEAATMRDQLRPMTGQRLVRYGQLIKGRSITVAANTVPIDERDLAATGRAVERRTPDEVIASMAQRFDDARRVISVVSVVWDVHVPRLAAARARCATLDLGADLADQLLVLAERAMTDPVSLDIGDVDEGVRRVTELEATLSNFAGQLVETRSLLDDAAVRSKRSREARAHTCSRVAAADLPEPVSVPTDLSRRLAAITPSPRHAGDLTKVRRELECVIARCDAMDAVCDSLLAERRSLRGMLDAYEAKADRIGVLEDPRLADLYAAARAALYTAPCDLQAAARELSAYQMAIAAAERNVTR